MIVAVLEVIKNQLINMIRTVIYYYYQYNFCKYIYHIIIINFSFTYLILVDFIFLRRRKILIKFNNNYSDD